MLTGLQHMHSLLRYVMIILLIVAVVNAFFKMRGKQAFTAFDNKLSFYTFIFTHIQLLIALVLYAISPIVKGAWAMGMGNMMASSAHRFYGIEHAFGMLIAIGLITFGRIKSKKLSDDVAKHKTTFVYFLIALLIIMVSTPWPFRNLGTSWL
jgi:hypothetical protein